MKEIEAALLESNLGSTELLKRLKGLETYLEAEVQARTAAQSPDTVSLERMRKTLEDIREAAGRLRYGGYMNQDQHGVHADLGTEDREWAKAWARRLEAIASKTDDNLLKAEYLREADILLKGCGGD